MSGKGMAMRSIFEKSSLRVGGIDVSVYKGWNTDNMTRTELRAVKEKGAFHFRVDDEISKGDVIQPAGSKSFWRVVDTDEEFALGTATHQIVRVEKIDELGNKVHLNAEGRAVFYGNVTGGVQVGGHGNTQTVQIATTGNADFDKAVEALLRLVENSGLSELDKEEVSIDIQRMNELAKKPPSVDLVEKAQKRLSLIKTTLEVAGLVGKASPYLAAVGEYFDQMVG